MIRLLGRKTTQQLSSFPSAISTLSHTYEIEIELNQILCKLSH